MSKFTSINSTDGSNKKLILFTTKSDRKNSRIIIPYGQIMVTNEERKAFLNDLHNFQTREQYYGRCNCPRNEAYKCTMDCFVCPFQKATEFLSLNDTENANEKERTLLEDNDILLEAERKKKRKKAPKPLDASSICSHAPLSPESYTEAADNIANIFRKVSALGTEEEKILQLLAEEYTNNEIIEMLHMPRSTYYDKLKKIKKAVVNATAIQISA